MVGLRIKIDEEEFGKLLDSYLDELAEFIFTKSQENIVNKGIIDEGTLLKSGNINRSFLNKEIVYTVPYADSIEFGRIPGSQPPVEPIKLWVMRKLGVNDDKEAESIAWGIANKMKKNGTDPRPFLQPAIDAAKTQFKFK